MDGPQVALVDEARERLRLAVAEQLPFPEVVFALRDGECLLVAGGAAAPDRRLLGAALVVAAASGLLHVSHVTAAIDSGRPTDALGVLELTADGTAAVEVHALRPDGAGFDPPVRFAADSAVFGSLVDELRATWSQQDEAFRIAALQRLEADGLLLEVAPALDVELTEVLERRARRRR